MIIYESTKKGFLDSVFNDTLAKEVEDNYRKRIGKPNIKELSAWTDSMLYMEKVLHTDTIPDNAGVAIEFRIPSTNKRVDFLISGSDSQNRSVVVIIELKRWDRVEKVDRKDGIIKTNYSGSLVETYHPSYQVWSYYCLIRDFNETVQHEDIGIQPCAYLHNLDRSIHPEITDPIYAYYVEQAPVYTKGEALKLREFIRKYIKIGDDRNTLYRIDNGKLRPSKSLQDHLVSLLKGKQEFVMIDDQKLVYEAALDMATRSKDDTKKRVLIVEGGPGTGKSVVAVNLLVELTKRGCVTNYVSKNSAPRNVYSAQLKGSFTKSHIDNLFKGSGTYVNTEENLFDALIVDEAHRLNEKSGMFRSYGENQIKEIIKASKFSVFFIDEGQRVTFRDIGEKGEILRFSDEFKAESYVMELSSQFRCNGSDGYLSWIDSILFNRINANADGFEGDFDFQVVDDPNVLRDMIYEKNKERNKARIVAGYCWDWITDGKNRPDVHDIVLPDHDFSMSWNLANTSTWAIDTDSVREVGCIHTSQGLEFDYVGVLVGDDLYFEDGKVLSDYTSRARTDQSLKGIGKLFRTDKARAEELADVIVKNTYRTLLTRGMKGCYVYCTDRDLLEYMKERWGRVNARKQSR
jgi:DUF2075 family protein